MATPNLDSNLPPDSFFSWPVCAILAPMHALYFGWPIGVAAALAFALAVFLLRVSRVPFPVAFLTLLVASIGVFTTFAPLRVPIAELPLWYWPIALAVALVVTTLAVTSAAFILSKRGL